MRKIFLFYAIVFTFFAEAFPLDNGKYLTNIIINNYAYGPFKGYFKYELLYKDGKLIEALNLKSGKMVKKNDIYAYRDIKQLLKEKNIVGKYKAPYTPNSFVTINSFKAVSPNFHINPLYERKKELKREYKKWISKRVKNYKIKLQDSRYKKLYTEGVELTVRNGQIFEARDNRTLRKIDPNNIYFMTVRKLFGIAKWGIAKDAIIIYNHQYGYPQYLKFHNGIEISVYSLKPL